MNADRDLSHGCLQDLRPRVDGRSGEGVTLLPACGVSHDVEPVAQGERQAKLADVLLFVIPILGVLLVLLVKWWRGW